MPLELAIRPRIRLREDLPAMKRPRRLRLPKLALPVLAYWAVVGGTCHALLHWAHAGRGQPDTPRQDLAEMAGPLSLATPEAEARPEPPATPSQPAVVRDSLQGLDAPVVESHPIDRPFGERSRGATGQQKAKHSGDADPSPAPASAALDEPSVTTIAPVESVVAERSALQVARSGRLPTCEAASAAAVQDLDFSSADRTADLPSSVIAGVLERGAWFSACGVPASTHFGVCVAIRRGHVTAVTVTTRPANAALEACIQKRAAALQFPYSTRLDIARTQF